MNELQILYISDIEDGCKIVYKNNKIQTRSYSSLQYIEKLCFKYGRNRKLQAIFVSNVLKIQQKLPVLLDVRLQFVFFPVYGIQNEKNVWIHASMIKKLQEENHQCKVIFMDESSLLLPVHVKSIQCQRRRCRNLLRLFKESIV